MANGLFFPGFQDLMDNPVFTKNTMNWGQQLYGELFPFLFPQTTILSAAGTGAAANNWLAAQEPRKGDYHANLWTKSSDFWGGSNIGGSGSEFYDISKSLMGARGPKGPSFGGGASYLLGGAAGGVGNPYPNNRTDFRQVIPTIF